MKTFAKLFPWLVVGGVALCFAVRMFPPRTADKEMNIHAAGSLPVQENGRQKPLDTFARTRLTQLYHRQSMTVEDKINKDNTLTISADRWVLSLMATGLIQRSARVTITDPRLLNELGLKARPAGIYSIYEFQRRWNWVQDQLLELRSRKDDKFTRFDIELVGIYQSIQLCGDMQDGLDKQQLDPFTAPLFRIENEEVIAMLGLVTRPGFRFAFNEIRNREHPEFFEQFGRKAEQLGLARERGDKIDDLVDNKVLELATHLKLYRELLDLHGGPGMIPVANSNTWLTLGIALDQVEANGQDIPGLILGYVNRHYLRGQSEKSGPQMVEARTLSVILYAFAIDNAKIFNEEVASYHAMLDSQYPAATSKSQLEMFFNDFDPFYLCVLAYVLAGLLSCLGWLGWATPLRRTAFALCCLTVVLHTWALLTRMYIMGRPAPVTNLYSSAVFIGWGCVVLCLVLEWIFHKGFGNLVASILGALTLLVAMYLDGGDTFEVLEPVLNTTFWLATHVTIVTTGYTATLVAGFIGMAFIIMGVMTRSLDKDDRKTLSNMIYGVVCFATLLSFVGTVLGGIWADQSWGRFWGWDPKENGALLIVIWNALILHARWGGMIKDRGMAVLSVVGTMITGWSWFGTNQLGVGLHAYGFNKHLAFGLVCVWIFQAMIVGLGCIPLRYWQSFNGAPPIRADIPPVDTRKFGKINKPGRPLPA